MRRPSIPWPLAAIPGLGLLLFWFSNCSMAHPHTLWQDLTAPGGTLRIEYDEPPAYGSHTLYFSYRADGQDDWQPLDTLELNNDGANLGEHNLEIVERTADGMQIQLRAQQQGDQTIRFKIVNG